MNELGDPPGEQQDNDDIPQSVKDALKNIPAEERKKLIEEGEKIGEAAKKLGKIVDDLDKKDREKN
jgi:hypothetical protein